MSRSVNKAIIVGHVGSDPEVRATNSGVRVATLSVATGRQWTDKAGAKQEKTEWHRAVAWDKLAEIVERYVKKGDRLYIEGEIEYRSYEKDGETKYMTEIRVRDLVMLGGKDAGERQPAAASKPTARDLDPHGFPEDDFDSGLPF